VVSSQSLRRVTSGAYMFWKARQYDGFRRLALDLEGFWLHSNFLN